MGDICQFIRDPCLFTSRDMGYLIPPIQASSVNDKVITPLREGLMFTKLRICMRSYAKIKFSRKFPNLQYIFAERTCRFVAIACTGCMIVD